jgi:hypothetical protein
MLQAAKGEGEPMQEETNGPDDEQLTKLVKEQHAFVLKNTPNPDGFVAQLVAALKGEAEARKGEAKALKREAEARKGEAEARKGATEASKRLAEICKSLAEACKREAEGRKFLAEVYKQTAEACKRGANERRGRLAGALINAAYRVLRIAEEIHTAHVERNRTLCAAPKEVNNKRLKADFKFTHYAAIEVKPTQKQQQLSDLHEEGALYVISRLSEDVRHLFNPGGVGVNRICHGAVLTLVSVEIFEMELSNVGTEIVEMRLRRSEPHFLFDEHATKTFGRNDLPAYKNKGFGLIAGFMLGLLDKFPSVEEVHYSDADSVSKLEVNDFHGAGGFSHVFKLDGSSYVKIPRSPLTVPGLIKEMETIRKLRHECIPEWLTGRMGIVHFQQQCETTHLAALRLSGLVGSPASDGNFDEDQLRVVFESTKQALMHAHSLGIAHLDVRPSNIIWRQESIQENRSLKVQLCDWGCALCFEDEVFGFRGFESFAHDDILRKTISDEWSPQAKHDIASLAFTIVALKGSPKSDFAPWSGEVDADAMCEERKRISHMEIMKLHHIPLKDELRYCLSAEEWLPAGDNPSRKRKRRFLALFSHS